METDTDVRSFVYCRYNPWMEGRKLFMWHSILPQETVTPSQRKTQHHMFNIPTERCTTSHHIVSEACVSTLSPSPPPRYCKWANAQSLYLSISLSLYLSVYLSIYAAGGFNLPVFYCVHNVRLSCTTCIYSYTVHTRQVKGGEEWTALSDIKAVHVSVTANSGSVPYTSLRKDAIAHREVP